ncbi:MAG TPA: OmpA family protein [Silvibacterium sp.]|nr:OmpA family protein [Silvibacterium sp.]
MTCRRGFIVWGVSVAFAALIFVAAARAQNTQIQGVINGRSGPTMTVQTGAGTVTVLLTSDTQAEEVEGLFHARRKELALTALEPGLSVQVSGSYNAQNQLVADTVKFKGSSLSTATDIQAGVTPVEQQAQQQQQQIQQQQQQLAQQNAQLQAEQKQQEQEAAAIAANKAAIAAVNKRFGELGDYNIWDEVTVYFGNGKVTIDPQYLPKLQALAEKAITVKGYVIQVQGYASKVGSAALNQRLSQERATNVVDYLEQQCNIPLTNMLAPGAMGTSKQVDSDATAEGQAENRRVVVRVLQNKGIAGT